MIKTVSAETAARIELASRVPVFASRGNREDHEFNGVVKIDNM